MTIERQPLDSLFNLSLKIREPKLGRNETEDAAYSRDHLIITNSSGRIVATVSRDDLFDEDGNRFYTA